MMYQTDDNIIVYLGAVGLPEDNNKLEEVLEHLHRETQETHYYVFDIIPFEGKLSEDEQVKITVKKTDFLKGLKLFAEATVNQVFSNFALGYYDMKGRPYECCYEEATAYTTEVLDIMWRKLVPGGVAKIRAHEYIPGIDLEQDRDVGRFLLRFEYTSVIEKALQNSSIDPVCVNKIRLDPDEHGSFWFKEYDRPGRVEYVITKPLSGQQS